MLFTLGHMNLAGVMVLPDRVFAGFVPEITAVQPPAASVLIEGQSVQDMAGFAAVTAAGNFTTNVADGGIALVEVLVLGDAVDVATPLFAGQSAGFSVTVRDTAGTERVFATALITVAPVPEITAVQPPAASVLIEGQSVQDMAGFAAVTAAGNFTTNVADGGIALVEVLVLGDAVDVATPLFAGQSAGFSVTVRDTAGTERVFATALITVAPVPSAWAYTVEEQGVQITSWPAPGITPISILEVTENRALLGL